jgi:hypothetical protein
MKKSIPFLKTIPFIFFLFFAACIDSIEFERPDSIQNAISIQGKLTKGDPSQIIVQIKEVFDFRSAPRLIDARYVQLIDLNGNMIELPSKQQGIYQMEIPKNGDFPIEYGAAYKIKIELNNAQVFESTFDTLYAVPTPNAINFRKEQQEITNNAGETATKKSIIFSVDTHFRKTKNSQKTNLLWEFESVRKQTDSPASYISCPSSCNPTSGEPKTCYITLSPFRNYKTLNSKTLSGDEVIDFIILEENATSYIFAEGYYLNVWQQSISPQAYEYWSTVNLLTNRNGSIFEAPSGKVTSNILSADKNTNVFGFFFVTEAVLNRIFIAPDIAGNPKPVCPTPPAPDGSGPGNCCNCLCEENSTTTKPDWWEE